MLEKIASRILSQNELIDSTVTDINLKLSPTSVKNRLNECFLYKESILYKYGLLK
jgi:hypothetical protein